jgi:hypothetical protein
MSNQTHMAQLRSLLGQIETEGNGKIQTGTTLKLVRSPKLDAIKRQLEKYGHFPKGYPTTPLPVAARQAA